MPCSATRFNPRPTSLPGDTSSTCSAYSPKSFQSTPDITAGRHLQPLQAKTLQFGFNPRPTSLPGDTRLVRRVKARGAFQSTPDITAGRHVCGQRCHLVRCVSIHARHHCRATRSDAACFFAQIIQVSIHARHHCRATPYIVPHRPRAAQFQSTPDITAGRHHDSSLHLCAGVLFQSTPDITAGRHTQDGDDVPF